MLRWVFVFTDLLFPAQDVVFVGAILGAYARIDGFVRPGGPDHDLVVGFKLVIRISDQAIKAAFGGIRVRWILRNFWISIKSVSRFIVVVQIERNNVGISPGIAIDAVESDPG